MSGQTSVQTAVAGPSWSKPVETEASAGGRRFSSRRTSSVTSTSSSSFGIKRLAAFVPFSGSSSAPSTRPTTPVISSPAFISTSSPALIASAKWLESLDPNSRPVSPSPSSPAKESPLSTNPTSLSKMGLSGNGVQVSAVPLSPISQSFKWSPPLPRSASTFSRTSRPTSRVIPRKPVPTTVHTEQSNDTIVELSGLELVEDGVGKSPRSTFSPESFFDDIDAPNSPSGSAQSDCWCEAVANMDDGLWTTTCDSTWEPIRIPSRRQSSTSSIPPDLSRGSSRQSSHSPPPRRLSRKSVSSDIASTSTHRRKSSTASLPRVAFSSFDLPQLELPHLPTLFPAEGEQPYTFIATPTPSVELAVNPLELSPTASTASSAHTSSSSSISHDSDSTAPTSCCSEEEDGGMLAPLRRISIFRVPLDDGKTFCLEAPVESGLASIQSSPRDSVYKLPSTPVMAEDVDDDEVLVISMPKVAA